MKQVYVLTGRTTANSGVFDGNGNYFGEAPIVEVYSNYNSAKNALDKYLEIIYKSLSCCEYFYDVSFLENMTIDDLKRDYNMDKEEYDECEIQWVSKNTASDEYYFQMYAVNVPWDEVVPIFPFLRIEKMTIKD